MYVISIKMIEKENWQKEQRGGGGERRFFTIKNEE
jgi:hypothetical protein